MLGRVADAVTAVGLGDAGFRLLQRIQALRPGAEPDFEIPPRYLRVLTAGSADAGSFLRVGRAAAEEFVALARQHGAGFEAGEAVLDFGCGCGRVARHMSELLPQVDLHGCDINPRLVNWCRAHLDGRFELSSLSPPLPYADGRFGWVYSLSVFTHMHEPHAAAWFAELARVTRPGGLALLTFLDDRLPGATSLQPRLSEMGFAVRREGAEGSNLLCGYFTPEGLAARAAPDWTLLDCAPSDRSAAGQAVAVLGRR
jgi:SAM-dependent methyltransferase